MVNRNVTFVANEHYHVFNRGNNKQKIFLSASDYDRFISLLYLANTTQSFNVRDILGNGLDIFGMERPDRLVRIGAYCLMPNHFHLALVPEVDEGISKFMLKLGTGYAKFFNQKYERTGRPFEGPYKAKLITTDEYLKYLFSYIHLNPVRYKNDKGDYRKIADTLEAYKNAVDYQYSTLSDYFDLSSSPKVTLVVIDPSVFEVCLSKSNIRSEIFDWLSYEELM